MKWPLFKTQSKIYLRSLPLAIVIGCLSGLASAGFLAALEWVTHAREAHLQLIYLLPVAGFLVGLLYQTYGKRVEAGNNLIIDEFHDPTSVIPFRMAPLVLLGTLITHLVGGSAGREGTAVQMGASIADQFAIKFGFARLNRRRLLMMGMSGGFGSVFGVPFAGTIFGMEVLSIGKIEWCMLFECAVSAFIAHFVTLQCGIQHTHYVAPLIPQLSLELVVGILFGGLAFGLAARLFAMSAEAVSRLSKTFIPNLPFRSFIGGLMIALIYFCAPTTLRYSGLGVPILVASTQQHLPTYDWLGKIGMTALTLGTGFKGGEVTPLLFIGATLGNALGLILPVTFQLLAAVGMVSVFAGAANTPLACTLMAMELFGPGIAMYAGIGCYMAYLISGHHGIYHRQRIHRNKHALFQVIVNRIWRR